MLVFEIPYAAQEEPALEDAEEFPPLLVEAGTNGAAAPFRDDFLFMGGAEAEEPGCLLAGGACVQSKCQSLLLECPRRGRIESQ